MKAIIYTRFSPRKNADESESCETQRAICEQYCNEHGHEVVACFDDRALSGSDAERPGLWSAIEQLSKDMILVVYRADRLARDVYLSECIRRAVSKAGAIIETVQGGTNGTSAEDVLIRQVLAAFAEYERKVIALRTKYAMLHHQRNGKRMSRFAPYGQKIDPDDSTKMIEDDVEQQAIKKIKAMHQAGDGTSKIARAMDELGYPARSGKWNHKTVGRIIKRL